MSGSDREALLDVREWLEDPPEHLGVVKRPSRMSRSDREGPPKCPRVVERPSLMSRSVSEALPAVREWSGGPSGCPGVV